MSKYLYFFFILLVNVIINIPSEKSKQFNFNFQQHDYKFKPERAEVVNYDKSYLRYLEIATFKYNRTCTAFNVSVSYKINFGTLMEVVVQFYKFLSNEYRYFPLRFQVNLCAAISGDIMGILHITKCGNLLGCPLLKDRDYLVCNFVPNEEKLPPMIPNGRYMIELIGKYGSKEIWTVQLYAEVYRPFA